jgi:hypothetical protein
MKKLTFLFGIMLFSIQLLFAQDKATRPSPPVQVTATINSKTITIDYGQPSVKGREIFGKLIPYGQVWRAGANETTAITISADAIVEGKTISAGKYALFMIPNEKEWTIIFNKTVKWGAFSYKQEEDVLRVNVPVKKIQFTEKLIYEVAQNGTISMAWANTFIQFGILFSSQKISTESVSEYTVFNRTIEKVNEKGKEFIRFSEGNGAGVAWLTDKTFSEGTIEFEVRGRDQLQGSFVGIAFHGSDNLSYENVYFRPFNFQSTDPIRKIHAVQYSFEPKYGWKTLRDTRNGEFEKSINSATIQGNDWVHTKIEVKNGRIKVFVDKAKIACLDVPTLNPNNVATKIGFLVGNNSNGDFANLVIKEH